MLTEEWQQIVATLGTTVRGVRLLLGWSQQQLADQAVVSQGAVSRMEAGHSGAVPFHSVVVILQTLAAGAAAMDVPISPAATQLFAFTRGMNGTFALTQPLEPDLAYIARTLERIPRPRRADFLTIVRAVADALADDLEETTDA